MDNTDKPKNILIIKLGAFGDFIQALGPMAAIRRHHPDAAITLLTTTPFVTLARESGYVDDIWVDSRPRLTTPRTLLALGRRLRGGAFDRVYDLQNNDRTALYMRLCGMTRARRPEWVGAARGASHRNASPQRVAGHAFDGHVQTLAMVGIDNVTLDPLDWVRGDTVAFGLPHPYVLLVPGSAPQRPEKRWPAAHYGALAATLAARGFTPVIIGTLHETPLADEIRAACPAAIDLCGRTALTDLVALARDAAGAIGNDTGPMHLIAPTRCPVIVLFSRHSDPVRHAPRGPRVRCIRVDDLNRLGANDVVAQIGPDDFRHHGGATGRAAGE